MFLKTGDSIQARGPGARVAQDRSRTGRGGGQRPMKMRTMKSS